MKRSRLPSLDGMWKAVKLGIIGVGSRGTYLLNILREIPDAEITAFCDNYEPHYTRTKNLLGSSSRGYYDYRVMLEWTWQFLAGVRLAARAFDAEKVRIGIEDNKPEAISALRSAIAAADERVQALIGNPAVTREALAELRSAVPEDAIAGPPFRLATAPQEQTIKNLT